MRQLGAQTSSPLIVHAIERIKVTLIQDCSSSFFTLFTRFVPIHPSFQGLNVEEGNWPGT